MSELPIKNKVFAYVTRGTKLLVFVEKGFESFGRQIPAGHVDVTETPEEAVLRETEEETGISNLRIIKFLGVKIDDQRKYGLEELHRRYFFQLECLEDTPENWSHEEKDPSIITPQTPERIIFDIFWVNLNEGRPHLAEGHDAFLDELLQEKKEGR
jgi:8-oxo-dGTP pyrophosphatase MutT (NUDIX family)